MAFFVLVTNCEFPVGLALASGLAATMTITHMLKAGDGIVCMNDVYGGKRLPSVALKLLHQNKLQDGLDVQTVRRLSSQVPIVTFERLLLKLAWMCHLLTVQNWSCSRPL